jgi:tetratricopeptide (TPR) repeat protein
MLFDAWARRRLQAPMSRASDSDLTLPGDDLVSGQSVPDAWAEAPLERGTLVGRYIVLARIDAGGMGVVYAAYDPDLDRNVALKLLLARDGPMQGAEAFLGEAQALAKLSHPNVVAVHDVGIVEGRVFIAMELVTGATLRAWLSERARPWREVLSVLRAAGQGLAAAHAAGVVHGDFKPHNVMVSEDPNGGVAGRRVRVMDFGLARRLATRSGASFSRSEQLAGTPAYMAPEQLSGSPIDARTDQFSFCVTLWEALFGAHPFAGETLPELVANALTGSLRTLPRKVRAKVPASVRRVCERGLATDPTQRWSTTESLIAAMDRATARTRLHRRAAVGAGAALCLGAVGVVNWIDERREAAACEADGATIEEVWNERVRALVRESLVATNVGYAEVTAEKVMPWLDGYAATWRQARTAACLDAHVREVYGRDVLERAVFCFDEHRMALEALVVELSTSDPESVEHAVPAAAGLPSVQSCRDLLLLGRLPLPPSEARDEVRSVREELSRGDGLLRVARLDEALAVVTQARERAEAIAWPPLVATARLREASVLQALGRYEPAEEAAGQAYFEGARVDAWDVATRAATRLIAIVGTAQARHAEAVMWGEHSEVARDHAGDPSRLREAERLEALGEVARHSGDYDRALDLHGRALAIREEALGGDHPELARSSSHVAVAYRLLGDYRRSRELHERALALQERALGPDHPDVATTLSGIALVHGETGAHEEERASLVRALEIEERALGPEHPSVAGMLNNLGNACRRHGDLHQARTLLERALAIQLKVVGPEHPDVAGTSSNLGITLQALGEPAEALQRYERALEIYEHRNDPHEHRARPSADRRPAAGSRVRRAGAGGTRADSRSGPRRGGREPRQSGGPRRQCGRGRASRRLGRACGCDLRPPRGPATRRARGPVHPRQGSRCHRGRLGARPFAGRARASGLAGCRRARICRDRRCLAGEPCRCA